MERLGEQMTSNSREYVSYCQLFRSAQRHENNKNLPLRPPSPSPQPSYYNLQLREKRPPVSRLSLYPHLRGSSRAVPLRISVKTYMPKHQYHYIMETSPTGCLFFSFLRHESRGECAGQRTANETQIDTDVLAPRMEAGFLSSHSGGPFPPLHSVLAKSSIRFTNHARFSRFKTPSQPAQCEAPYFPKFYQSTP